ncbi:MAG: PAS domain-containing protein [Nitrospiraceae bacterium]
MKLSGRKQGRSRRLPAPSLSDVSVTTDLLEGLPFGVVILQTDLTVRAANREGRQLLGLQVHSCVGKSFPVLWSKLTQSDTADTANRLNKALRNRHPAAGQQLLLKKSHTVPVKWTCVPNEINGARVLIITIRDLSYEMELEQDRDRLAAIAEESPLPMVELDRDMSLLYANPAMISLLSRFGYSP